MVQHSEDREWRSWRRLHWYSIDRVFPPHSELPTSTIFRHCASFSSWWGIQSVSSTLWTRTRCVLWWLAIWVRTFPSGSRQKGKYRLVGHITNPSSSSSPSAACRDCSFSSSELPFWSIQVPHTYELSRGKNKVDINFDILLNNLNMWF